MGETTVRRAADVKVRLDGQTVCLELAGELSLATAYPMMMAVQSAPNLARCTVDLTGVCRVAPGGIEALQDFLLTARTRFSEICLVCLGAPLHQLRQFFPF
jgi:ABC-type transporter Mla MlaB component